MEQATIEQVADFKVEGGCPACGGALDIRKTASSVWSYCEVCHQLAKPIVGLDARGLKVFHRAALA